MQNVCDTLVQPLTWIAVVDIVVVVVIAGGVGVAVVGTVLSNPDPLPEPLSGVDTGVVVVVVG